jgi:hypothetical protein
VALHVDGQNDEHVRRTLAVGPGRSSVREG